MYDRGQLKDEKIDRFISIIKHLNSKLVNPMSDEELLDEILIENLTKEYAKMIRGKRIETIEDLANVCRREEAILHKHSIYEEPPQRLRDPYPETRRYEYRDESRRRDYEFQRNHETSRNYRENSRDNSYREYYGSLSHRRRDNYDRSYRDDSNRRYRNDSNLRDRSWQRNRDDSNHRYRNRDYNHDRSRDNSFDRRNGNYRKSSHDSRKDSYENREEILHFRKEKLI